MAQPPKKKALPPTPPPKPKTLITPTPVTVSVTSAPNPAPTVAPTPQPAQPIPNPTAQNLSASVANARGMSPRAQPSRGQQAPHPVTGHKEQPQAPAKPAKSRIPGWIKKPTDEPAPPQVDLPEDFWENLPPEESDPQLVNDASNPEAESFIPEPQPEPEPEPQPEPVNSDESVSEGGTGFNDKVIEFRKVESEVDAFHGADKDERSEWTKLAEKAQSGRSPVANSVIKQHTRLIRISGKGKTITLSQVELSGSSLNLSEVFLLDIGAIVYQWDGANAGTFLKNKANWYLKMLRDERRGKFETIIMDWNDDNPDFYEYLGGKPDSFAESNETPGWVPVLYRVTITVKGNFHFKEVGSGVGTIHKELLSSKGVFLYDLGFEMILWEGKQAFKGLRDLVMQHGAEEFKSKFDRDPNTLVTRVKEGGTTQHFLGFTNSPGLNPVFNAFIGQM